MSDGSFLAKRAEAQYRPIRRMEGCRRYKDVLLEESKKVNHEAGVTSIMDGIDYRGNLSGVRIPSVTNF